MSDDTNKSILLVKKADAKKGSLWNKLTNTRIIKQHGGFDIPEGDNHAIPKYRSPLDDQKASPEDTKETLNELEKEIHELQEKDKRTPLPQQPSREQHNDPDDHKDRDDDLY